MAESPSLPAATVVLRKRKRTAEALVLHLASSPSPSCDPSHTESEYEPGPVSQAGSSATGTVPPGNTSRTPNRQYKCTHGECSKAYTKPSRLAEHQRSHTGDRPHVCAICNKSYLRETHLQAHARSHMPESARPLSCNEPGCHKRFWTAQHLRVHEKLHTGEMPFKCTEPSCDASFSKHHQLREHLCTVHSPPGTKPYQCGYTGCTKSFSTNQKLRAHFKIHNDQRYTCVHSTCAPAAGALPTYYSTWSALQHHMRTLHPPTCPHASCNEKTFNAQSGLRAHLKLHAERDAEAELEKIAGGSASETEDEGTPRKRRRGGEIGRDWVCTVSGCEKDFKSKKALTTHTNVFHLGRRDFVCPHSECQRAFGYKHLLQRHLAKVHSSQTSGSDSEGSDSADTTAAELQHGPGSSMTFNIALITGSTYAAQAQERIQSTKTLTCPYPSLPQFLSDHSVPVPSGSQHADTSISSGASCEYVFSRAYDLRRHLGSAHGITVDRESVDEWVKRAKKMKAGMSVLNFS